MIKIYIGGAMLAFALSFVFCCVLIPVLRKLGAGQNILAYVKEHKKKNGTPTMGGLAFIAAAVLSAAIFIGKTEVKSLRACIICLAVGVAYMMIGLLDDWLKKHHKENLGLRAWEKFFFQFVVAVLCAIYCYRAGFTDLYIPFFKEVFHIGRGIVPLSVFVFLATVNGVNLTDGLDGLAAGVSVPFFATLGILIGLQGGERGFSVLSFCLVGALLAYLCFNISPASVFMGDTGSLALGGFASSIATFSGNALYLAVVGVCFAVSVISVILQVIYYKATGGKRIFLMAPIHHHFQMKGYSESRISYGYFIVTLLLGCVCLLMAV